MKIIDVQQNTDEWYQIRGGIPTASAFSKIVTAKGSKSDQRDGYMYELAGKSAGFDHSFGGNASTARGHELEPDAANYYAALNDVDFTDAGFILSDCENFGGSPDRLINPFGGLEIKCCEAKEHNRMIAGNVLPTKHKPQVYGLLWLTERKWWDFMAYHPTLEKMIIRTKRSDPEYQSWIAKFVPRLNEFCESLNKLKIEIGAME